MPQRGSAIIKPPRRRGLEGADVARVLALVASWPEDVSVTWDRLADRVEEVLRHRWTRQTLEANSEIKAAYRKQKDAGKVGCTGKQKDPAEVVYERRIETMRAENEKLRQTLTAYEERFALHQYNSLARGISVPELEAPLPEIDRRRTDVDPRQIRSAKGR